MVREAFCAAGQRGALPRAAGGEGERGEGGERREWDREGGEENTGRQDGGGEIGGREKRRDRMIRKEERGGEEREREVGGHQNEFIIGVAAQIMLRKGASRHSLTRVPSSLCFGPLS